VGFYIPIFMSLRSKPLERYSLNYFIVRLLLAARHARAEPLISVSLRRFAPNRWSAIP
jgi:hypothetical protein